MAAKKANGETTSFKIEDGIQIPRRAHHGRHGALTAALSQLKVGQSILIPTYTRATQLGSVRSNVQARMNIRLITRAVEGGVRVWRVS